MMNNFFPIVQGIAYHHIIQKMVMVYMSESKSFLSAKKGSAICSLSVLPVGKVAHPADEFSLVALGTPSKLLILSMKPQIELCFKLARAPDIPLTALPCTAWKTASASTFLFLFLPLSFLGKLLISIFLSPSKRCQ